jgi:hypothetical protein
MGQNMHRQIAEQAIEHPDRVFTTLIHRIDVDFLREVYHRACAVSHWRLSDTAGLVMWRHRRSSLSHSWALTATPAWAR